MATRQGGIMAIIMFASIASTFWTVLIVLALVALLVVGVRETMDVHTQMTISSEDISSLMASFGADMSRQRYLPVSQSPGLYVYQRENKPSCLVGLILLILCLIPGIIYLVLGGSKNQVVIHIHSTGSTHALNIDAPRIISRRIVPFFSQHKVITTEDELRKQNV